MVTTTCASRAVWVSAGGVEAGGLFKYAEIEPRATSAAKPSASEQAARLRGMGRNDRPGRGLLGLPWYVWAVALGGGLGLVSRLSRRAFARGQRYDTASRTPVVDETVELQELGLLHPPSTDQLTELVAPENAFRHETWTERLDAMADLPAAENEGLGTSAATYRCPGGARATQWERGGLACRDTAECPPGGVCDHASLAVSGVCCPAQMESSTVDAGAQGTDGAEDSRPAQGAFRSSWHTEEFRDRCGGMVAKIKESEPMWAERAPVVWRCGCKESGLGDRLKGITAAWMLAVVLGRPFACDLFPSMVELEYGVEPVLVDWRKRYQEYVAANPWKGKGGRPIWSNRAEAAMRKPDSKDYSRAIEITQTTPAKIGLLKRFISEVLGKDPSILSTEKYVGDGKEFTSDDQTDSSHPFRAMIAHAHFCASRALFRPTAKLLELLDLSLREASSGLPPKLLPGPAGRGGAAASATEPFVIGVSARFGGRWKDRKRARDGDVNNIVSCAWNMSLAFRAEHPDRGVVWLLASDQIERLSGLIDTFAAKTAGSERWKEIGVSPFASKEGIIEHVVKSVNGSEVLATKRLWLDWFLMSEVHTCALIRSSFPRTACYVSTRRDASNGLVQQLVTRMDLGRYPRIVPSCTGWRL